MSAEPTVSCFATCAKGLEYLLRDELAALGGANVREALAGVHFEGQLETVYRVCLGSRLASRVLWPLATFDAPDDAALVAGVAAIDWAEHLDPDGTLAVDATCVQSELHHSRFVAQRVKDAVVDQFRERSGRRPDVALRRPDLRLNLLLRRKRAILTLDLAGEPLHRRGWRQHPFSAPLKENLAAAMLLRAGWPKTYAEGGALLDPMCGGGTLVIEAALMAAGVAPGLHRDYFGFLGWRRHDAGLWQNLVEQARQQADTGLRDLRPVFHGSDIDPAAIAAATANAQEAGVAGFLQLARHDVRAVTRPTQADKGLVICNPPYGERIGDHREMPGLYAALGEVLKQRFPHWRAAILVGDGELGHALGLRADKRYRLYNGALECTLLLLDLSPVLARPRKPLSAGASMVANRLRKNLRHLDKRMLRDGVSCYRIYDRDLPEYAAAVDVYCNASNGERWLNVQEYKAPQQIDAQTAGERFRELLRALDEVLDVPRERFAVKTRRRQAHGERHARGARQGGRFSIAEHGLLFEVNLLEYLDTGLFLDHRLVRGRLRDLAADRSFLNLFAYTGAATVHAAAGDAADTTSVDLSATYLEWASRNLAANGFTGRNHQLAQADAFTFLAADRARYGLIFVDPPTFSNSSAAADFDVQRDHVRLLKACGERLEPGGIIVFSNNYRRFRLDRDALDPVFDIEDWTKPSIPEDFARTPRIHGCWLMRARPHQS